MKHLVKRAYYDTKEKRVFKVGEVVEMTASRAKEVTNILGHDVVEETKEKETEKGGE